MKHRGGLGYAPNFTNAFLVMLGINLFIWGFFVLAFYGFPALLISAAGVDVLVQRFGRPRH